MSARTIFCQSCGVAGAHRYGKDRRRRQRYKCSHCHKIFTRRTRSLQSGSQLTDAQWTMALKLFCTRGGMSAEDIARLMGINRKTAQKLNRVFRVLVKNLEPTHLPGATEWDESVMSKQWILGGVSRQMRQCILQTIPNRTGKTLVPAVEAISDPDGLIFTDEWLGYTGLSNRMSVCHSKEFVNSQISFVHTNTQEGIWGHMKPLSHHIYRGFPRSSLPQFLSEVMFRYNIRSFKTRVSVLSALLTRKTNSLLV